MVDGQGGGLKAKAGYGAPALHSAALRAGEQVTVIKLHPFGHEVTRYPATVLDCDCPVPWFAVQATWVNRRVDASGLVFEIGDTLIEFFSTEHWFDVFHEFAPDGTYNGWYANVTYPTRVEQRGNQIDVIWHDLYLDLIKLPGRDAVLCDEDELAESGLEQSDPDLHANIRATADRMMVDAESGVFPFVVPTLGMDE